MATGIELQRMQSPTKRTMLSLGNLNLLVFLILTTFLHQMMPIPLDTSPNIPHHGPFNSMNGNGNNEEIRSIKLLAQNADISGGKARLKEDKIVGWYDTSVKISWDVSITQPGQLEVIIGLTNTESTSGAIIEVTVGETTIVGSTRCSGSIHKVRDMIIGVGMVKETGTVKVTVKATHINGNNVGHLHYLIINGYVSPLQDTEEFPMQDLKLTPHYGVLSKTGCTKVSEGKLLSWTDSALQISWEIDVITTGIVDVFLGLANSQEQAGVEINVEIGEKRISGITKFSGGLDRMDEMKLGSVSIYRTGKMLVVLTAEKISYAGVGHFYYILLRGIKAHLLNTPYRPLPEREFSSEEEKAEILPGHNVLPGQYPPERMEEETPSPGEEKPEIVEVFAEPTNLPPQRTPKPEKYDFSKEITGIKGNLTQADINGNGIIIIDNEKAIGLWQSVAVEITWEINIANAGELEIYINLANEPEEEGAIIEIEIGEDKINGVTQSSGGLDIPLLMYMGKFSISSPGTIVLILRAAKITKQFVGQFHYILLSGPAAEDASFVTSIPKLELLAKQSIINGHGAILIGDEKIGKWTSTSVQFIWEIEFESVGQISVSLVLANIPSEVGSRIMIDIGGQKIIGTTVSSGGLNQTSVMPMGKLHINEIGRTTITVQAETIVNKNVGELFSVILKGTAARGARLMNSFPEMKLDASEALISGPGAIHMENKIVDWNKTSVKLMWDVTFENPGELYIYLAISNTLDEAEAEIEFRIGDQSISGFTASSGGRDVIQLMPLGSLAITSSGPFRIVLRAKTIKSEAVGNLYYLLLKGSAIEGAKPVQAINGLDLKSRDAKISGSGAVLKKEIISNWIDTTTHIIWEVNIAKTGLLDLSLAIANKPEEAGVNIEIKIGEETIVGQTGSSGGKDKVQIMHMGTVHITTLGTLYIIVRAANITHVFVGDFYYLRLSGPASEAASIAEIPSNVRLPASTAIITSNGASHFGDEKITFWENKSVKIIWEVKFIETGKLSFYVGLSNTQEQAHARIEIFIGPHKIVGTTVFSGGSKNIQEMLMGITTVINPGTYKISLRAENILHKYVGDLYYVILSGPASKGATQTNVFPKVQLFASDAIIDGSGASYLENNQIGEWDSTSIKIMWDVIFTTSGDLYVSLGLSNTANSVGSKIQVSIDNQNISTITRTSESSEDIQELTVGQISIRKPGKQFITVQAINITGNLVGDLYYIALKGPATKDLKVADNASGIRLNVSDCVILGNGAVLKNDRITSWRETSAKIIWELTFNSVGNLYISLALANKPIDAGAKIKVFVNDTSVEGITISTNGLENIFVMAIGLIKIDTVGIAKITVQADNLISREVGDFYYLLLKGSPIENVVIKEYAGKKLLPKDAKITGKTSKFSENKIINWIQSSTHIMWEVSLTHRGILTIIIGIAVNKEDAGSEIEVQIGNNVLKGIITTYTEETSVVNINMGSINISSPGTIMISLHANKIKASSVGELHYILLKGSASFEANVVEMSRGIQLQASDALITGHGAAHFGDEMISFWSNTNATINWEVNFVQTGQLLISIGLGNKEKEANTIIEVTVGNETIRGTTIYSGGLTNPETMRMGFVLIKTTGIKRIILRAISITDKEVGNLFYLICEGTASRGATYVDMMHRFQLNAIDAIIEGTGIGFVENKFIGGWTNPKAKIVWPLLFNNTGEVYVSIGLSNTEQQVGAIITVQIGKIVIEAPTITSGGLDRIQLMPIGKLTIPNIGKYDIIVQAKTIKGKSIGDFYYLLLKGPGAQEIHLRNINEGIDLQVSKALITGKGIERIGDKKIGNWTGTSANVMWDIIFPTAGSVYIYIELENTQAQSGASILATIGNKSTTGVIQHVDTYALTLVHIGTLNVLAPGEMFLTLKADHIKSSGIGSMDKIQLRGSAVNDKLVIQEFPTFQLNVSEAVLKGPEIIYDSKSDMIKGWKDTKATITWNIDIPKDDWLEIWIALENTKSEANVEIEITFGKNSTIGKTIFSGDKPKLMYIGSVYVHSLPNVEFTLRAKNLAKNGVGKLYYVQLRGIMAKDISISSGDIPEVQLETKSCRISGPGADINDNNIIEWRNSNVHLEWELTFSSQGKFQVIIVLASFSPGSVLEGSIDDQKVSANVTSLEVNMGMVEIKKPGIKVFTLRARNINNVIEINLISIIFRGRIMLATKVKVAKSLDAGTLEIFYEFDSQATIYYNEITLFQTYPLTFYAVIQSSGVSIGMKETFSGEKNIYVYLSTSYPNSPNDETIKLLRKSDEGQGEIYNADTESVYSYSYNYDWELNKTYKFMLHQQPNEAGYVTTTAFFYHPEESVWKLLASVKRKAAEQHIRRLSSYIRDDSKQFGYKHRLTTFSPWIMTTDGKWQEILSAVVKCPIDKEIAAGYVENGVFVLQSGDGTKPCTEYSHVYERKTNDKLPIEIENIVEKLKIATEYSRVISEVKTNKGDISENNQEEQPAASSEEKEIKQEYQLDTQVVKIGSHFETYYWLITETGERNRISKEEYEELLRRQQLQHQPALNSENQQQSIQIQEIKRGSEIIKRYWLISSDGQRKEISKEQYEQLLRSHQIQGSSASHQAVYKTGMQQQSVQIVEERRGSEVIKHYWLVSTNGQRREISKEHYEQLLRSYQLQGSSATQQAINYQSGMQQQSVQIVEERRGSEVIKHYWLISANGQRREISKEQYEQLLRSYQHQGLSTNQQSVNYQSGMQQQSVQIVEERRGSEVIKHYWLISTNGQRREISKEQYEQLLRSYQLQGSSANQQAINYRSGMQQQSVQIVEERRGSQVIKHYWLISANGQRKEISKEQYEQLLRSYQLQGSSANHQTGNSQYQTQTETLQVQEIRRGSEVIKRYWLVTADGHKREISEQEAVEWKKRYNGNLQNVNNWQQSYSSGHKITMSSGYEGLRQRIPRSNKYNKNTY